MAGGGLAREMGERGGEPGVDTGERAPIGLVGAARCVVAARVGQIGDGLVDRGMLARNRRFGAERVDRVEIETEHRLARAAERGDQRNRGDERRSEERQVGEAGDSTCSSPWWTYDSKKK